MGPSIALYSMDTLKNCSLLTTNTPRQCYINDALATSFELLSVLKRNYNDSLILWQTSLLLANTHMPYQKTRLLYLTYNWRLRAIIINHTSISRLQTYTITTHFFPAFQLHAIISFHSHNFYETNGVVRSTLPSAWSQIKSQITFQLANNPKTSYDLQWYISINHSHYYLWTYSRNPFLAVILSYAHSYRH